MTGVTASASASMPAWSGARSSAAGRTAGKVRRMTSSTRSPAATLTAKIHRQDAWSARTPASNGPATVARKSTAPITPWALPRSSGANRSAIAIMLAVMTIPPPTPCTARNAVSCVMVVTRTAGAEPATRMASPMTKNTRRP